MRIFLLDSPPSDSMIYSLKSRERNYLSKVLRLSAGTIFTAKDKNDNFFEATIIDDNTLYLKPTDTPEETLLDGLSSYNGSFSKINAYVSMLKGKKNEIVVRALTEIGVSSIVFVETEFVQEKSFSSHQAERLSIILKEAVQQSGGKAPVIIGPVKFNEAIAKAEGIKLILHQSSRTKTTDLFNALKNCRIDSEVSIFIGPEGGFSDEECEYAESNGAIPILLKTNILRAETASIYTAAVVQSILHH